MGLRNARPLTIQPRGLTDATDGTNTFPGAMASLANLVPDISNAGAFVSRPAAIQKTAFAGFTAPAGVTAMQVLGTRIYGMISSGLSVGKDQPFCYDMATGAFVPITITNTNFLPHTQALTGDWTPPTMSMVTNGRVIVTHPGFNGGVDPFFGWIDLSNYNSTALVGNTTSGSPIILGIQGGSNAPVTDGVQQGYVVTGTGIPAGTLVINVDNGSGQVVVTADCDGGTNFLYHVVRSGYPAGTPSRYLGLSFGMLVTGPGVPAGTFITGLDYSSPNITLSHTPTPAVTGGFFNLSGGGSITLSNNATATNIGTALTILGGTSAAPIWGAGNLSGHPLVAVPKAVAQYGGRAWYAVGNSVAYSDTLLPCQASLATQVLTIGDGEAVTALAGLPLLNTLTGGVTQSLFAFKGAKGVVQITGDAALGTLAQNAVNGSVGTLAPNTICGTPRGLMYVAVDGLRVLQFDGTVSDPIGAAGQGVQAPFVFAVYPSRMAAAFNEGTYRVSLIDGTDAGNPVEEYWYDGQRGVWTGPHSFPAAMIKAYHDVAGGFISAAWGIDAKLWQSSTYLGPSSTFTENGVALSWTFRTVLLPDNQAMSQNRLSESTAMLRLSAAQVLTAKALDETGTTLDTVSVTGAAAVGGILPNRQYALDWTKPLNFKQMAVQYTGASNASVRLGNFYLRYQILGYMLPS